MALTENGKISIKVTTKLALQMLWAVRMQHVGLSLIAALSFFALDTLYFSISQSSPHSLFQIAATIFVPISKIVLLIALVICWQRLFLIGSDLFLKVTKKQFIRIWLKLTDYIIAFFIINSVLIMIFSVAIYYLLALWPSIFSGYATGENWLPAGMISTLIVVIINVILIARTFPLFSSICVEGKISFLESLELMKEHTGAQLSIFFLILLSAYSLRYFYNYSLVSALSLINNTNYTGSTTWVTTLVFVSLSPVLLAIPALQLAIQAIIYRDLSAKSE